MTTHVNLSTFPIEDIETAIKLARRKYFSSCYAMTKNDLMKVIGRIMLNDWHLIVDPKTFVGNEPIYGDEIEKLLKEYFRFYYTKEGFPLYLHFRNPTIPKHHVYGCV